MFAENGFIGGRRLGEASRYGCAFRDKLLPCTSGKPIDASHSDDVMKIAAKDDLLPEIEAGSRLNEYKIASNYFVIPRKGICKPSPRIFDVDTDTQDCPIIQKKGVDRLMMIQMPYGGDKTVSSFFKNNRYSPATFNFYEFGKHIIEAIALATLKGVIHRDLHTANILLDSSNVPRIIDFGLCHIMGKTDASEIIAHNFEPRFPQRPPEVELWLAVEDNVPLSAAIGRTINEKRGMIPITFYSGSTPFAQRQELQKYANTSQTFRERNIDKWLNTYWTKYDAWAIGNMLLSQFHKLNMHPAFKDNREVQAKKPQIIQALRALTRLSPIDRVDAVKALTIWAPESPVLRMQVIKDWLANL
jgi:serine/threonine protein kinase